MNNLNTELKPKTTKIKKPKKLYYYPNKKKHKKTHNIIVVEYNVILEY